MAPPKPTPDTYRNRILKYSEPVPESGCWLWTRTLNESGYGQIYVGGAAGVFKFDRAHRVSYRVFVGEIPEGVIVCHKCDVRECVNPDHLFLGTHQDNVDDMMRKGRHRAHKGEECHNAKLTEEQVREIRFRYRPWVVSQRALAKEYGVSRRNIQSILANKSWMDL